MSNPQITRFLSSMFGGAASLALALGLAAPAWAQDGQRTETVPVTNPETDKEIHEPAPPVGRPATSADLLPPVPASINDPAPFGTRAVGVDPKAPNTEVPPAPGGGVVPPVPGAGEPGAPGVAGSPGSQPTRDALAGIHRAEGVVTELLPAQERGEGKALTGELVRLKFDPNQSWLQFSTDGPALNASANAGAAGDRPIRKAVGAVKEALDGDSDQADASGAPAPDANHLPVMTLVVTRNTHIFVHARTREGQDLYGIPTISSPDRRVDGIDVTGRRGGRRPAGNMETNFTNIREGSFISVRYRMVGDLAEAVNLNLVEFPVVTPEESEAVPGAAPNAIRGRQVGPRNTPAAGAVPVEEGVPVTVTPGANPNNPNDAPGDAPARVPVVPGREVSPGTLPK